MRRSPPTRRAAASVYQMECQPPALRGTLMRFTAKAYRAGPSRTIHAPRATTRSSMSAETIQPVVLVGGRSRRFGRDKLREAWVGSEGGAWLVDQPRLVLRAVFGVEPWAAGDCDPLLAARFARVVPDPTPGAGPAAGIVASLDAARGPVAVLAGDLPCIARASVRALLDAAAGAPDADAIVARTDRLEPCIAIYRTRALSRWAAGETGRRSPSLRSLLDSLRVAEVPIAAGAAVNLNRPEDLDALEPLRAAAPPN